MGNKQSVFTDEQLETYQDSSFFTRREILKIYEKYKEVGKGKAPGDMSTREAQQFVVPFTHIENMPEFKENPFRTRICEVFAENSAKAGLTFNDFLDMYSVFSVSAPRDIKTAYAFKVYDFDQDDFLGKDDLTRTVNCLTKNQLNEEEVEFVVNKLFQESDLDDDHQISYAEFEHVISRAPDFASTFHIGI